MAVRVGERDDDLKYPERRPGAKERDYQGEDETCCAFFYLTLTRALFGRARCRNERGRDGTSAVVVRAAHANSFRLWVSGRRRRGDRIGREKTVWDKIETVVVASMIIRIVCWACLFVVRDGRGRRDYRCASDFVRRSVFVDLCRRFAIVALKIKIIIK